jgi:methionyl aminopeptidase
LHGLPHDYAVAAGDIVSIDFAASVNGWVADSAISYIVGDADPEDLRVIRATEEALVAGIAQAVPGKTLGDISAAIGDVAASYGYTVNMDFGGHGVGREMHGDPHVPNDGRAGRGYRLREGLVIAIEPWFMRGTDEIYTDADGWTLRSADGSRGAHSEHTVAITADGPIVLTDRAGL